MILQCIYEKTIYRDEKLGDTMFSVIPRKILGNTDSFGNHLMCSGTIPNYPKLIPLELNVVKDSNGLYRVLNCKVKAIDESSSLDFLSSEFFPGIGPSKAEKYINEHGFDIFNNPVYEKYEIINEKTKKFIIFEELLDLINNCGGNYHVAYRLYKKYGMDCLDILNKDPYQTCCVAPFELIDRYATQHGVEAYEKSRVDALIKECFSIMESRGDTCLSIEDFCKIVNRVDSEINPLYVIGEIINEKEFYFNEKELSVYDSQLYMCEENISFNISKMEADKVFLGEVDRGTIEEIEKEGSISFGEDQLKVFDLLRYTGVKIITGGPGTGKTTVINGLIKYIHRVFPEKSIVMAAPTANAAKRIREKTGEQATTIHKLLEIKPFADSLNFGFKNLNNDFVIIDECSFIDTRMASIIFQSVRKDSTVILVGDVDQLPSVAAGNVYKDLIESGWMETVRLETIFRQSGNSSIIDNAFRIKNGNANLITDDDFSVLKFEDEKSMFEAAVEYMSKHYDKNNPYSVRLYTPVRKRKYMSCTYYFNKQFQDYFSEKNDDFVYGYTRYYVGDPVIFTRNNYPAGYANGDEGKIISILQNESGKYGVSVSVDDNVIDVQGDNLLDMELSFAITTHKSQGSECDTAVVIVPASPKGMLDRSLIYVAATRARKKTLIFTEGNSLYKAIHNNRKKDRNTGLQACITDKFQNFPIINNR